MEMQELNCETEEEKWIKKQIPLPETARLHHQAEQPFQSMFLHPPWRLRKLTRMEIERGTNGYERRVEPATVREAPTFLTRTPTSAEDNPCPARTYATHVGSILVGSRLAEPVGLVSGNVQQWKSVA